MHTQNDYLVGLMSEPIVMKFGMYIMPPEPIAKALFINPSHQKY
jgi:hypothetical protein